MNNLDMYTKLIADQTGVDAEDVCKVLEKMQNIKAAERTMRKATLKKGMSTFVGCDVGERRLGRSKAAAGGEVYNALVKSGYLTATDEGTRVWYALTNKGKTHVARVEAYYAKLF
jgi:hypothetical protein